MTPAVPDRSRRSSLAATRLALALPSAGPSWTAAALDGVRAALAELERSGVLAAAVWTLYRQLDGAPDFPIVKVGWGPFRITLTKERTEPALRWLLTRLVGPEPAAPAEPAL